jgi:hypothetical protein
VVTQGWDHRVVIPPNLPVWVHNPPLGLLKCKNNHNYKCQSSASVPLLPWIQYGLESSYQVLCNVHNYRSHLGNM